jgi:hypothetical protein
MSTSTQTRAGSVLSRMTPGHPGDEFSPSPTPRGWGRWLLLAAGLGLAGYLLFCHGCHGDEDNELFAVAVLRG